MKNIIKITLISLASLLVLSSCIKEFTPQTSYATKDQVSNAPGSYNLFVSALTSTLVGDFTYGDADDKYPFDFGIPAFFLERDVQGQDIVYPYQNWYTYWYAIVSMGPGTRTAQLPWTSFPGHTIMDGSRVATTLSTFPVKSPKAQSVTVQARHMHSVQCSTWTLPVCSLPSLTL